MAGDAAGQWANTLVRSAMGSEVGGLFGGALGGAVQGAAMGSLASPVGPAVGAAVGGGIGLLTGGAQAFEARDDAFKSYYGGVFDTQYQAVQENQASGSQTAAQRQLDAIAFQKLITGGGGSQAFLSDLAGMAANTPFEYSDLTAMSKNLAIGFGSDPSRILSLMTGIGNAGATVGASANDMQWLATALSRMQSTNLAQLGEINMFQDRGIDVIGMLAEYYGKGEGDIRSMITHGEIGGRDAVSIIEEGLGRFAGAMDEMSKTFEGRSSTLSDTMDEIYNAGGASYNQSRSEAMAQEIEAYGGALGDAMKEAYEAIGAGKAAMENLGEAYTRDALSAVLEGAPLTQEWDASTAKQLESLSEEYQAAMADYKAGNEEAGVKIDDIIASAEGLAQQQYEASDLYRSDLDAQADSLEALRENTSAVRAAAAAYGLSQERTKGMGTGVSGNPNVEYKSWMDPNSSDYDPARAFTGDAFGLDRVPKNGLYYLHEDERVSTAREAREQDVAKSRGTIRDIIITDNNFGAGVSAEEIAQRLADQIEMHLAAGALS